MKKIFLLLYIFFFISFSYAQFGMNKVRYMDFKWKFYKTKNFDIYYYGDMEKVVAKLSLILEDTKKEYEERMDIDLKRRIPVILYADSRALSQTNILDGFVAENVGGFADISKRRLVIPFNGNLFEFEKVVRHEMTHIFQYEYMFPEQFFTYALYSNFIMPPLWVMEGMAEYFSNDWQPEGKMILRESVLSDNIIDIPLQNDALFSAYGYYSYKLSQSFFDFLSKKYGEKKIVVFFKKIAVFRAKREQVFKTVFGVSLKDAVSLWKIGLRKRFWKNNLSKKSALEQFKIVNFNDNEEDAEKNALFMPIPSPNGDVLALYSNYKDEGNIILISAKDGTFIRVLTKGFEGKKYLHLLFSPNAMFWEKNGIFLWYAAKGEKYDFLIRENILTKKTEKYPIKAVSTINSFTKIGNDIFFIGQKGGFTQLFRFSLKSKKSYVLTENLLYKRNVVAISKELVAFIEKGKKDNVILFNVKSKEKTIVFSEGAINSLFYKNGKLYFDAKKGDAFYIFSYDFKNKNMVQLTNSLNSTLYPSLNKTTLFFNIYSNGRYKLSKIPLKLIKPKEAVLKKSMESPLFFSEKSVKVRKESKKYKIKFFPDYFTTSFEYNTEGYFRGYSSLLLSDLFGDYRIAFNFDLSSIKSFDDINMIFLFNYMKKRYTLGASFYAWKDYYFHFLGREEDDYVEELRGGMLSFSYPLDMKDRVEVSANIYKKRSRMLYIPDNFSSWRNGYALYTAFVRDCSRWYGYYHPLSGYRMRISFEKGFKIGENVLDYGSALYDFRKYFRFWGRVSFAWRFVYGESWGKDATLFKLGGINSVRGYEEESLRGTKILLNNFELRFPVIDYIIFPIKDTVLPHLRMVLFYDTAFVGRANDEVRIFITKNGNTVYASNVFGGVGYGFRIYLGGFFMLKFDWAWRTDFEHIYGNKRFHFGIARDF